MVRYLLIALCICPVLPHAGAESKEADNRASRLLAMETRMSTAREYLRAHKPEQAVATLEEGILEIDGNAGYLALMKEAYLAVLQTTKKGKTDATRLEHIQRQLKILDPNIDLKSILENPVPAEKKSAATAQEPVAATSAVPRVTAPGTSNADVEDPFQQIPLDRMPPAKSAHDAVVAFNQKKYIEAGLLFRQATQAGVQLSPQETRAWGYCRIFKVNDLLSAETIRDAQLAEMETEVREAARLGGDSLAKISGQVLAELNSRRHPASNDSHPQPVQVPLGWYVVESPNFRVMYKQDKKSAESLVQNAESLRTANYEKWFGPAGQNWSPLCEIWIHATAADYAKETGKPETAPGHSTIGMRQGQVHSRRIDLHKEDATFELVSLPREIAYIVLNDLFPDQPLPRWANTGMMILAEPASEITRFKRALLTMHQQHQLFSVSELLKYHEFPQQQERITSFYVTSVSFVDFLVHLKGSRAFALYLREAPRRGFEECLKRHYGFKNVNEIHERWIQYALRGS